MMKNVVAAVNTINQNATAIEGAAAGVVGAVGTALAINPPSFFKRFYYYCLHNNTTLTDPKAKSAIDLFYRCIRSILDENSRSTLDENRVAYPEALDECLENFKSTLPDEKEFYQCQSLATFDIVQIKKALQTSTLLVNGKRATQETLPSALIDIVYTAPGMKKDAELSVPKVIFAFLISMSLAYTATDNLVEKKDLVKLMHKVAKSAFDQNEIRDQFNNAFWKKNRSGTQLKSLIDLLEKDLKQAFHLADSVQISNGAKQFKCFQVERTKKRFNLLLALTEGQSLETISGDFNKIAQGDLSIGCSECQSFSNDNPFRDLLMKSASIFSNVDESYKVINPGELGLKVPALERVVRFIKTNLEAAHSLVSSNKSILLPLLKTSVKNNNQPTVELIAEKDGKNISIIANFLHGFAMQLAKDVEKSLVAAHFLVVINQYGQIWLDRYSMSIEDIMKECASNVDTDNTNLDAFSEHMRDRLFIESSQSHPIMEMITAIQNINTDLKTKGIVPLQNFKKFKLITTPVIEEVNVNLQAFFSIAPQRLGLRSTNVGPLALLENNTTIEKIKTILTKYAADEAHQYKFRCSDLAPAITIPETDARASNVASLKTTEKHKARLALFYKLFEIIVRRNTTESEIEKLNKIRQAIAEAKAESGQGDHFLSNDLNGIASILSQIEGLITDKFYAQMQLSNNNVNKISGSNGAIEYQPHQSQHDDTPREKSKIVPKPSTQSLQKRNNMTEEYKLVTYLRAVMKHIGNDLKSLEEFELFFKKLVYLNKQSGWFSQSDFSKIRQHQKNIVLIKQNNSQKDHYLEISNALTSNCDARLNWGKSAFAQLQESLNTPEINDCSGPAEMKKYLESSIDAKEGAIKLLSEDLKKYQSGQLGDVISQQSELVWSKELQKELEATLTTYATAAGVECSPKQILKTISARLLQTDIYGMESEKENAEKALSDLLEERISEFVEEDHLQKQQIKKTFIEGLLMLGANPVPWMNKALANNLSLTTDNKIGVGLIFGQLSSVIVSQLFSRAKYLGDTTIYLEKEIQNTLSAMDSFISALQHSTDGWFWFLKMIDAIRLPFLSDTTFHQNALNSEHRDERISLSWSVVKLIYVILNHSLVENSIETNDVIRTSDLKEYTEAKDMFMTQKETCESRISEYSWHGWIASFVVNVGRSGYNELAILMAAVDALLKATTKIATNRAILLSIQKKYAEAEQLKQNVIKITSERDEAKSEREKANEITRNTIEVLLKGIKNTINRSIRSSEVEPTLNGINALRDVLLVDAIDIYPDVSEEQLMACIDECISSHPKTQPIQLSLNRQGMFSAKGNSAGRSDTAKPSAERASAYSL